MAASPPPWQQYQQAAPPAAPPPGPVVPEQPKALPLQNAVVGAGQTVLTNFLSSGMTGDPELFKFGVVCNVAAQMAKQHPRFNEKLWTLPFMVLIGVCFCVWYFRDPAKCCDLTHPFWSGYFDISPKGVLDGITAAFQASANYHGLQATGVSPLTPTPYARSFEARTAA